MKVSAAGRAVLTQREGKRNRAYYDTEGVLTIGVGHTGRMAPPPVTKGMVITDAQVDDFLAADLAPVEKALNAVLRVRVTQNQFDAMASFLFNVGVGWAGSGGHPIASIFTRLNAGDVKGAADSFDLFHKPAVIIGRRNSEKKQFLTPDASTSQPAGGPSPVPAAPQSAAKETKPMSGNIDILAGLRNTFQNLGQSILTGASAVADDATKTVTEAGKPITNFGADIATAKRCGQEVMEIVGDFARRDLAGGVDDAIDLVREVFGALDRHGVKVPLVTDAIKSIDLDPNS